MRGSSTVDPQLFAKEIQVLEEAKANIQDNRFCDNELITQYSQLAQDYNKLLKLTAKVCRISDMQGNELAKLNENLEAANERLMIIQKSRKDLMSNISHELGTPMQSIKGYVQAMLQGMIPTDDKKYLSIVYEKINHVEHLIQDLFALSMLEARQMRFNFTDVDICDYLQDVHGKLDFDIRQKGAELILELIENLQEHTKVTVEIDPTRMNQVMFNIIFNAVKHIKEAGKIHIGASLSRTDENTYIIIKIADNGEGISGEMLPTIFERFVKGSEAPGSKIGGAGLGLAISKEIVTQHNGEISVKSEKGVGTTFYITLPVKLVEIS